MGNFKLTTVEEFEAATEKLLETGKKVGADAWQYRAAKQTPDRKSTPESANPFEVMMKIRNAGAIFIGEYSSEPLGDYFAGPNHVLPTNGTAKFFSPLGVDDFMKRSSIIYYSREALKDIHKDIIQFAEAEKLTAQAKSIRDRLEEEEANE